MHQEDLVAEYKSLINNNHHNILKAINFEERTIVCNKG
jgi:hypothetical protein